MVPAPIRVMCFNSSIADSPVSASICPGVISGPIGSCSCPVRMSTRLLLYEVRGMDLVQLVDQLKSSLIDVSIENIATGSAVTIFDSKKTYLISDFLQ